MTINVQQKDALQIYAHMSNMPKTTGRWFKQTLSNGTWLKCKWTFCLFKARQYVSSRALNSSTATKYNNSQDETEQYQTGSTSILTFSQVLREETNIWRATGSVSRHHHHHHYYHHHHYHRHHHHNHHHHLHYHHHKPSPPLLPPPPL